MKFVILTEEEFEKFARNYENKCYLQSTGVSNLRKRNGWESHFVGIKKGNKVVAASLLLSKMRRFKKEFYAIRGPLVDFNNKEVLSFFITNLKKYVKDNKGYMLRIDPYVEAGSRDRDGNPTDLFDNSNIKDNLISLGFKEIPAKKMEDNIQAKFMYIIELNDNIDDVMKDMDSKHRQMIRKNEKMGIVVRTGTINDIPLFEDIMEHTSERRNFSNRGQNFYQNMYECLQDDKMISLVFAELDIDLARKNIELEKKEINKARLDREENRKLGKCNEKKALAKEKEEDAALERMAKKEKELDELEAKYGKTITLGGILYIIYENEVASLFGGSYNEFKEYQPFYTIHYEMIKYAIENKYERYNFYAISNNVDKNDEQYGIYQFKRGFGGRVMELIGEFVLPVDKVLYNGLNIVNKCKKIIKK